MKRVCYRRLMAEEREEISRSLAKGESFQKIASHLGRAVSTIAREVTRGGCNRWTYRADRAFGHGVMQEDAVWVSVSSF
jgi:IS30 family transposase